MNNQAIRRAARLYAGTVLLSTEPSYLFENANLTDDEIELISEQVHLIAHGILGTMPMLSKAQEIVDFAKNGKQESDK